MMPSQYLYFEQMRSMIVSHKQTALLYFKKLCDSYLKKFALGQKLTKLLIFFNLKC